MAIPILKGPTLMALVSEGWNDIGVGLKWAFIRDWEKQFHMAAGIGYEFGVGDDQALQDTDEYRFWLSVNKGFDKLHFGATANLIIAEDTEDKLLGNSDLITVHFHTDYYLTEWFSPILELNFYFVQNEGDALGPFFRIPFSGVDAVSLGGGEKEDTITGALGFDV